MSDPVEFADDQVNLRIQLSEARTDTKFAELIGKLDVGLSDIRGEMRNLNTRLDSVEKSTSGIKGVVFLTGISAVAVVVAILAFGQQWFGTGLAARDIVHAAVTELQQQQHLQQQ